MVRQVNKIDGTCVDMRYTVLGEISTNVYAIDDGVGGTIVCDPADDADAILAMVGERPVSAIFITHKHHDHMGALAELHRRTGAPVYASAVEAPEIETPVYSIAALPEGCAPDVRLEDNETFTVGATEWRMLLTPGHSPGSCCYYLSPEKGTNPQGSPVLLSGDTLFHGTIGRTDFLGGSMDDMRVSLRKLGTLPDETLVFPGHNEFTSIGLERWRVIDFLGATGE